MEKQQSVICPPFPSEPRFPHRVKIINRCIILLNDITRPKHRDVASVSHLEVHENVDESGATMTGNTYSSFDVPVRPIVRSDLLLSRQSKRIPFFEECSPVFGYECSVEEHIRYGQCLDGLCGKRAPGKKYPDWSSWLDLSKPIPYFLVFYLQQSVET